MISLIMPYWDRRELLFQSLSSLEKHYSDLELEVIVADDGSDLYPVELKDFNLDIKMVKLPRKVEAKNPCVPLNEAAAKAKGEFLAITNPEIVHRLPVLRELRETVTECGWQHYATAAVWDVTTSRWYNHSVHNNERLGRAPMPPGAGFHFLAMMRQGFFWHVGGFDESYREGQGYEDNDFLWKLFVANATFSIHDDLVVEHHSTHTKWPNGGSRRNRELFEKKWGSYLKEFA